MKRILLKTLPDPRFSPGDPQYDANMVDYRVTIEQAIRMPLDRQAGTTIDEMRKGIRILDALDDTKDNVLELEDADWEFLKQKVDKMPWATTDRRIITFYDDVTKATDAVRDSALADGVAR